MTPSRHGPADDANNELDIHVRAYGGDRVVGEHTLIKSNKREEIF